MKILAWLIAATLFSVSAKAQETVLFDDSHSPLETEWQSAGLRPELTMRDALLSNPAMIRLGINDSRSWVNDNPMAAVRTSPLTVALQGAYGKMNGDFIPVEGNRFGDYSVVANGMIREKNNMLYGKASFTSGSHRDIGWNAQRSPMTYWPYIVADSTGGDVDYETYNLLCTYSFRLNKNIDLGFSGEYKGDFAFRKTDPRIENITSWLTLKTGAAWQMPGGNRLAIDAGWQLHRQHTDIKHFRSGQFAGFFMEYGFGMYDYIHSPIYNSMKHQQHQHSYAANLVFTSNTARPLRISARLGYARDVMNTEENIHKLNLYRATTDRFNADASAMWNNHAWGIAVNGHLSAAQRNGREHIFERYVSANVDGVDIYDYRKIGKQDRYSMNNATGNAQFKLSRYIGQTSTLSLSAGTQYFKREEKYKGNGYFMRNILVTPYVGIEAKYSSRLADARLTANYGRHTAPQSKYNVNVDMDWHTEYQHAFSTYAYCSNTANVVTIDAEVTRAFSFARMGLHLQCWLVSGRRNASAAYDATRYAESIPFTSKHTVSPTPDRHDQHWTKISLFAEF